MTETKSITRVLIDGERKARLREGAFEVTLGEPDLMAMLTVIRSDITHEFALEYARQIFTRAQEFPVKGDAP